MRVRLPARLVAGSSALFLIAVLVGLALTVGAASGSVAPVHGTMPFAGGSAKKVIVLLRDKPAGLAARSTARSKLVKAEVAPLAQTLRSHGATHVAAGRAFPFVVASVSSAQEAALRQNPAVKAVLPDAVIPAPTAGISQAQQLLAPNLSSSSAPVGGSICGTAASPEQDPEALSAINAPAAWALGADGAGVSTAYIAGDIDPAIADFQRNSAYASSDSLTGSPVVTDVHFDGDPAGTPGGEVAGESFLDASSIAAQGNSTYDLNAFVNAAHPLSSPCDITVTGAAPGATVMGLDVFSNTHDTTESNFIQAIDYAVSHGVKVLNESFGGNPFPDTAVDATKIANDDAVAAGVTVVASTGDAGITNTYQSPSDDPKVIAAGATTTFRAYQQLTYGGINATVPNATNGTWLNNNISSISSSGFSQSGNTVDIVAPGDSNWAECSTSAQFAGTCASFANGAVTPFQFTGGTSESSPLTAAAAADVIQAYQNTHGGSSPSPALVKQILMSTATDIDAPAEQQGAGLLNIGAAVKEAESINGASGTPQGGLLVGPNQINITQNPNHQTKQPVSITNTGNNPVTVNLSTRTLTHKAASTSSSFCLNPSSSTTCGPPTANTFQIWSGATEVYQEETFSVPATGAGSRLDFSSNYPATGQTSLLHVALYDPSGAYAGYSVPQGLANFADMQVADPMPGTWTAVFFTVKNAGGNKGTSGTIQWQATTWTAGSAGKIAPGSLTIAPGATKTAMFTAKSPADPGDTAQSIVLSDGNGTTTIPVTVRTLVKAGHGHHGGSFSGVLTGGNGRGNPAQSNTYAFDVPKGQHDIDVSAALSDPNDGVVAYLIDPEGEAVASSSNLTLNSTASSVILTGNLTLYKDNPEPGRWTVALDWLPPITGSSFGELSEPFTGQVQFDQVHAGSNLPHGGMKLMQGQAHTFDVTVTNTAQSPETFFLDPRTASMATVPLTDVNGSDQNMSLPLPGGLSFPFYVVPTDTSSVQSSISASGPVTYDIGPWFGDPDVEAVSGTDSASVNITPAGGEVASGLWALNPSGIGPYTGAAPSETASANVSAVTQAFDSTVNPSTGDLWTAINGFTSTFAPVYLQPGQSASIPLTITPTASKGTRVSGFINLDDAFQFDDVSPLTPFGGGDELASIP
ncbi:MAG TPA: hypothetical protein VKB43_01040, partial [Gaiellaceae bacterium]|nr:hypothetical protein [Gaiellaceae bacterium]